MSSWLSGGLNQFSSITGQITSFTKEVLTETTEEVTDPAAELEVLRQKYGEQQTSYQRLEAELLKLKQHSEEQRERAETAECQISAISQEYRKLVESRDAEIRQLKTESAKIREEAKYHQDPHSPLKELAELQLGGHQEVESCVGAAGNFEGVGHYDEDFSDVISSQAEINRLRMELAGVRKELQQWKDRSGEKNDGSASIKYRDHSEGDYQRHQQEVEQLQGQVDSLQLQLNKATFSRNDHRVLELEELNTGLTTQLNLLKSSYREEQSARLELLRRLELEQASASQVKAEINSLKEERHHDYMLQEQQLNQEKDNLKLRFEEMQAKIVEQQSSIVSLHENYERAKQEARQHQEQVSVLARQLDEREKEINNLKEELDVEQPQPGGAQDKIMKQHQATSSLGSGVLDSAELEIENKSLKKFKASLEAKIITLEKEIEAKHNDKIVQVLQQENTQASRELDSLKKHLIKIQEQHSQECMGANHRERILKQQLADLQLKLTNSETTLSTWKQQQLVEVERQLQATREERDDALLKMENAQEQAKMNAESMKNLQAVLEQFQRGQSSELGQALKTSQVQLADALAECQQLKEQSLSLCEQLEEARAAAQVSSILNQELEKKESQITHLLTEKDRLSSLLQEKVMKDERSQVDRNLVKNLVLGYIHAADVKKTEVLHLIAKILEFTDDELDQALSGLRRGRGWLSGLWQTPTTRQQEPEAPPSLSRLFIKFLESESTSKGSAAEASRQALTGYVDPRTDPDRPSLSTSTLLGPTTSLQTVGPVQQSALLPRDNMSAHALSGQSSFMTARTSPANASLTTSAATTSQSSTSTSSVSFQSSLLKSVLT